jgi:uncharacterized protein (DUF697 family)
VTTETGLEAVQRIPEPIWKRVLAQPDRAPELIAVAAAERFAGPVEDWVQIASPGHSAESLAKTAYRKHVRLSRVEGLAFGFGGIVTGTANLGALAWIQARMVFYIAAAYGYDPRHPMRPAELLALWEVYDSPADARASLDGMGKSMAQTLVESKIAGNRDRRVSELLMRYVGKRVIKRAGGRLVPVIGAPISAVQNGGSTKDLGRRALLYYGGGDRSGVS